MTQPTQAIGYIRVSTLDQATEGVSLDAQREKIVAYCALHGLELLDTFADEGISGKRADNRPGLQRALDAVCKRGAVLVIYSLSRLGRSTMDCINICARLEKSGADLASVAERIDTTSSMGRFVFRLMASLGELERDQISERTTAAMSHMRRQGRRISRHIPYGFTLADDGVTLTPHEAEQQAIESMKVARAQGKTLWHIANDMNSAGIPSKRGSRWRAGTVQAVLSSR